MMEISIISKRMVLSTLFCSSLFLLFHTFTTFAKSGTQITACQEKTGTTYIITESTDEQIIVTSAAEKDIMGCIGHVVPFYDRTLEYVSSRKETGELSARYDIGHMEMERRDHYVIATDTRILLFIHTTQSPFETIDLIRRYQPDTVYMPQISPVEHGLFEKGTNDLTLRIVELKKGDILTELL